MNNDTKAAERAQRQAERKAEHLAQTASDLAHAERDAPIRARFHAWLEIEGFALQKTPAPGTTYSGAHAQMLWECFLAATLVERSLHAPAPA